MYTSVQSSLCTFLVSKSIGLWILTFTLSLCDLSVVASRAVCRTGASLLVPWGTFAFWAILFLRRVLQFLQVFLGVNLWFWLYILRLKGSHWGLYIAGGFTGKILTIHGHEFHFHLVPLIPYSAIAKTILVRSPIFYLYVCEKSTFKTSINKKRRIALPHFLIH